jgi:hypothetical protein
MPGRLLPLHAARGLWVRVAVPLDSLSPSRQTYLANPRLAATLGVADGTAFAAQVRNEHLIALLAWAV